MGAKADLLGQRFGHLSVVSEAAPVDRRSAWLCRCDCGNNVVKLGKDLLRTQRRGWIDSCGCQVQTVKSIMQQFSHDDQHLQNMHEARSLRRQRHDNRR